jgi:hypothetical protein
VILHGAEPSRCGRSPNANVRQVAATCVAHLRTIGCLLGRHRVVAVLDHPAMGEGCFLQAPDQLAEVETQAIQVTVGVGASGVTGGLLTIDRM